MRTVPESEAIERTALADLDAAAMPDDIRSHRLAALFAGDPQHSFGNIPRMGFESTHVRDDGSPPQR